MKALVGLDNDGRGPDQLYRVDRIIAAADAEFEDGRKVALITVVGLVAAPSGLLPESCTSWIASEWALF